MSEVYPPGKVISGKYNGANVYIYDDYSLGIYQGVYRKGLLGDNKAELKELYLITAKSITAFEEIGSTITQTNSDKVGTATFLFGIGAGLLVSQLGKQEIHNIAIIYPNGEKSLLQLNPWAYQTFIKLSFGLPNKIPNPQSQEDKNNTQSRLEEKTVSQALPSVTVNGDNFNSIITRIDLFIEDGEWEKANQYCESALDFDATNAELYLRKLLIDFKTKELDQLAKQLPSVKNNDNYKKALRFADEEIEKKINNLTELDNEDKYQKAVKIMKSAWNAEQLFQASSLFGEIPDYKDSAELRKECIRKENDIKERKRKEEQELKERQRKNNLYDSAKEEIEKNTSQSIEAAINKLQQIRGWRDADELILELERKLPILQKEEEETRLKEEEARLQKEEEEARKKKELEAVRKKKKTILAIVIPIACIVIAAIVLWFFVIQPKRKLEHAMILIESGEYDKGYTLLEELGKKDLIEESKLERAKELLKVGNYDEANVLFEEIGQKETVETIKYERAKELLSEESYDAAYQLLYDIGLETAVFESLNDRAIHAVWNEDYDEALNLAEAAQNDDIAIACAAEIIERDGISGAFKQFNQHSSFAKYFIKQDLSSYNALHFDGEIADRDSWIKSVGDFFTGLWEASDGNVYSFEEPSPNDGLLIVTNENGEKKEWAWTVAHNYLYIKQQPPKKDGPYELYDLVYELRSVDEEYYIVTRLNVPGATAGDGPYIEMMMKKID